MRHTVYHRLSCYRDRERHREDARFLSARAHAHHRHLSRDGARTTPRLSLSQNTGKQIATHTRGVKGAQRAAQPASESTARGQSDRDSMSGTGYQGRNSIPHLTVRDPAWSARVGRRSAPLVCKSLLPGIKFLVSWQRADGPSTVSSE